jgi:predicted small lipoprotein YifL
MNPKPMPSNTRLILIFTLLFVSVQLASCGQKGDLYLPEPAEKALGKKGPQKADNDKPVNER